LFVPLFGILKVIFDELPQLQPYGYILGKEEEEEEPAYAGQIPEE
jgi:hypothetical protein